MVLSRGGDGFEVRFLPLAASCWVPSAAPGASFRTPEFYSTLSFLPLGHDPFGAGLVSLISSTSLAFL